MEVDEKAAQYLAYVLGKFSGQDLTEAEHRAAVELLRTLPADACIKDFIAAASPDAVTRAGLPGSVAADLKDLSSRLELNASYAGKHADLFEPRREN